MAVKIVDPFPNMAQKGSLLIAWEMNFNNRIPSTIQKALKELSYERNAIEVAHILGVQIVHGFHHPGWAIAITIIIFRTQWGMTKWDL